MIYGESKPGGPKTALDLIRESELVFSLTGSRFFGTETGESDWDFFIQEDPKVLAWLIQQGFTVESETYKNDLFSVAVYKSENVHVQVVKDERMKRWVQYHLVPHFKALKPDKETQARLWRLALRCYKIGMNDANDRLSKKIASKSQASQPYRAEPLED